MHCHRRPCKCSALGRFGRGVGPSSSCLQQFLQSTAGVSAAIRSRSKARGLGVLGHYLYCEKAAPAAPCTSMQRPAGGSIVTQCTLGHLTRGAAGRRRCGVQRAGRRSSSMCPGAWRRAGRGSLTCNQPALRDDARRSGSWRGVERPRHGGRGARRHSGPYFDQPGRSQSF
jgi:hypothetical protein